MKVNQLINKSIIWAAAIILSHNMAFAQKEERSNIRKGNALFKDEKYTESEIAYRKSLDVNSKSIEGIFNLGNALYKQEKHQEAAKQYDLLANQIERMLEENPENAKRISEIFHNMGNVGMNEKDYAKSIEAYKMALRMNPSDNETRYNLALAQKLLQDQQSEDQDEQEQEQEDKEQEQENQEQKQNQNQEDENKPKEQEQEQEQQNEQMSRDNAQQMLDAFLQDEKDTQEKVKKAQMQQQQRRRTEKQW